MYILLMYILYHIILVAVCRSKFVKVRATNLA